MTDGHTVWVPPAGNRNQRYHLDRDCSHGPADPRPRDPGRLPDSYGPCPFCDPDQDPHSDATGWDAQRALRDADPEDIGGGSP